METHTHPYTRETGPVYTITREQGDRLAYGDAIQLPDGSHAYGETDATGEDCLYREATASDYGGNVIRARRAPDSTAGLLSASGRPDEESLSGSADGRPSLPLRRVHRDFIGFFRIVGPPRF